jgi:hypothetical protein
MGRFPAFKIVLLCSCMTDSRLSRSAVECRFNYAIGSFELSMSGASQDCV